MAKYSSYNIEPEKFVDAWQAASSVKELAEQLGMPIPILHARASAYRGQGIKLKKMPRTPKNKLDVDALNRRIEESNRKLAEQGRHVEEVAARADMEFLDVDRLNQINQRVIDGIHSEKPRTAKKK